MTQRALLMSACATGKVVPEPSNISREAAMKSVGEGLKQMKEAQGDMKTGLLPSEVTVTFYVAAKASDSSNLAITTTAGLGDPHGRSEQCNLRSSGQRISCSPRRNSCSL